MPVKPPIASTIVRAQVIPLPTTWYWVEAELRTIEYYITYYLVDSCTANHFTNVAHNAIRLCLIITPASRSWITIPNNIYVTVQCTVHYFAALANLSFKPVILTKNVQGSY